MYDHSYDSQNLYYSTSKTNQKQKCWIIVELGFIFLLSFLQLCINFNAYKLNPDAFDFPMIRSCGRQSKAFERSVERVPKRFSRTRRLFAFFFTMTRRQRGALTPCWKPHWNSEKKCVLLKLSHIKSANISKVSSTIFFGISISWDDLEIPRLPSPIF